MPEDQQENEAKTESTEESKVEKTEESKEAGAEDGSKETESTEESKEESKESKESEDELPAWARDQLTKARGEAANYRVRTREAEEKLKNAKTLEEVDEIVSQMTKDREESEHALLVENVALKFKLPEKAHKRLSGKTREELEADAKELAELFSVDDEDDEVELEGGLNPRNKDTDANLSPRELAKRYGRGSKRRR